MAANKLKIGFVVDDGLDSPDGVQQYVLTVGAWMKSQGHEVRYLAGETKRQDIPGLYSLTKNAKVRFSGNSLSTPLPASKSKIKQILIHEKFDILHIQVPYSPFCAGRVVRAADVNTVIVGTFHILPFNWLSRAGTWLLGRYLTLNLKKFNKMLSVSEPARLFAKKSFAIDSEVLPNPVRINSFKPSKPKAFSRKNVQLLFVGRLVPRKGCMQLLQAIEVLARNQKVQQKFILDICGDGPLRSKLEQFVRDNNLSELVTFHGFVSEEIKIKYMQQADIAIFPSYGGESFGIVLIEAMAAGAGIVIGGDNPGYRSVLVGMEDCIVNVHSPASFADSLSRFMMEPDIRSDLHTKQQKHVKNYDIGVVGSKLLKVYKGCISASNNR